jgi:hypothetical protein
LLIVAVGLADYIQVQTEANKASALNAPERVNLHCHGPL